MSESKSLEKNEVTTLDFEAYKKFINEFKKETDRAAVILGVARLDIQLRQAIEKILVPCTSPQDDLFQSEGPLGSFSAKIQLAYRMNLIDAHTFKALNLIRKIRNDFAHEAVGSDLSSGAHRDRVNEFTRPFMSLTFTKFIRDKLFEGKRGPSVDFRVVLAILSGRIEVILINRERKLGDPPMEMISPKWREPIVD